MRKPGKESANTNQRQQADGFANVTLHMGGDTGDINMPKGIPLYAGKSQHDMLINEETEAREDGEYIEVPATIRVWLSGDTKAIDTSKADRSSFRKKKES